MRIIPLTHLTCYFLSTLGANAPYHITEAMRNALTELDAEDQHLSQPIDDLLANAPINTQRLSFHRLIANRQKTLLHPTRIFCAHRLAWCSTSGFINPQLPTQSNYPTFRYEHPVT